MEIKTPPQNVDAEQSVLGAMLLDNHCIPTVIAILQSEDFYQLRHQLIFREITNLRSNHQAADLITVTNALKDNGELEKIGGVTYVATLANLVPTSANAKDYALVVKEKSKLRQVLSVTTKIAGMVYGKEYEDVDEFINVIQGEINSIEAVTKNGGLLPVKDHIGYSLDLIENRKNTRGTTGISTGDPDLDRMTAGWQNGTLNVIAARPSMGKTSLAIQLGGYAAIKLRKKVGIFSMEMSKSQLVEKLFANIGMVDGQKIRIGQLNDEDWSKIAHAASTLYDSELLIDDTGRLTVLDIKSRCRQIKQESGLDLVIIDYLQLIRPHKVSANISQEIGLITWELKALAKELQVPVILLSQLSRDCEKRGRDKRPILSDLRDSGSIEQDADMVIFIYRDDYYNPDSAKKGIAEINIAKQREGPTGLVEMGWFNEFTKFVPLRRD